MSDFSSIAILIPTINESTLETVVSVAIQQAPGAEIIIIGYGDASVIAKKYSTIFVDLKQKTKKSVALNRAVQITTRNWIIVLDADAIPESGWAESMLWEFKNGRQLFSGSVNISMGNYWMKVYNLSLLHEFCVGKPSSNRKHLPAISLGFSRKTFNAIGPFNEELVRSQDYEWTLRAFTKGIIPWFASSPSISHIPINKNTFSSVWRYWVNSGMDNLKIRRLYTDVLKTPYFMKWPLFIILTSPILALIPTFRIFITSPMEFIKNLHLIPFIYLTKIAWCLGAFKYSRFNSNDRVMK